MLQQQTPIGELVFYFRHTSESFLPNGKRLSGEIDALLDEVRGTTEKYGVNQASDYLKPEVFDFRVALTRFLVQEGIGLETLKHVLTKRLSGSRFYTNYPGTIGKAFCETLEKYLEIFNSMTEQASVSGNEVEESPGSYQKQALMPSSYDEVIATLNYFAPLENASLKNWLNAGLTLDYAFILSEMHFEKQVALSGENKKALESLLYNSVEDLGVYAHHFNIWSPEERDESQLNRNIKIRIAVQEALAGHTHSCSLEELKQFF